MPEELQDNFYVWSDDIYGDADGDPDGLPELPVSRIPDGGSAQLVFEAIQANGRGQGVKRTGVRNANRPFADAIYDSLPGTNPMRVSEPTTSSNPRYKLNADQIYFVLHGDYRDTSRFRGGFGDDGPENNRERPEAVNITNIPSQCDSAVVFSGCCWGALIVDKPAGILVGGSLRPLAPKTPDSSIALSFLARGARAFIGCTGVHYSPTGNPRLAPSGEPLHSAFWKHFRSGHAPAQALFLAKRDYINSLWHAERPTIIHRAIEYKTFRQFTCLGLGW